MTKLLVSAVAMTTLLASPAFAASKSRQAQRDYQAYASARGAMERVVYDSRSTVVFGNRVVGQDVDPNIRTQILHDPIPSEY